MENKSGERPLRHHSFILSLWTEGDRPASAPSVWRYSLEDPLTAERRGFKDLAELTRFLETWTAVPQEEPLIEE